MNRPLARSPSRSQNARGPHPERDGLISREPHPTDRRAFSISLSAKARLREVAEQATSGFSERELATFVAFLRRVVSNLDQASED